MNEISIVTAFFDIGRGDWTPDKGLPHYLQRTNDTYFERFGHMAKLENEMVVYTSEEFVDTIRKLRGNKPTQIMVVDFENSFELLRERVATVQNNADYQSKINPSQVANPEYWNADYVVVNLLKSSFVSKAIQEKYINNDLVAWLDFGYCREESTLNNITTWKYPFNKEKIHMFNIKDYDGKNIEDIIFNNDVHITGPCIVASKDLWPKFEYIIQSHIKLLADNNLMDDDQTLLLMSSLSNPNLFELHKVSTDDWFVVFRDYNEDKD